MKANINSQPVERQVEVFGYLYNNAQRHVLDQGRNNLCVLDPVLLLEYFGK